VNKT
jgi:hypothetical protein